MERIGRLWQDPRITFAVLGAASGVAGAVTYKWVGDAARPRRNFAALN